MWQTSITCHLRQHVFDLVVAIQIIEHVPSDTGFLQEINRIVTNGGFISISTPNRYRVSNLPRLLYNRVLGQAAYPYHLGGSLGQYAGIHLREYTLSELRYIINPEFTVILSFEYTLGYGNFCLPISRPRFLCYMLWHWEKRWLAKIKPTCLALKKLNLLHGNMNVLRKPLIPEMLQKGTERANYQ